LHAADKDFMRTALEVKPCFHKLAKVCACNRPAEAGPHRNRHRATKQQRTAVKEAKQHELDFLNQLAALNAEAGEES